MAKRYDIDQVRDATDIVEVISRYVSLTERGGQYVGLCPFHTDSKPSFSVSPDKQLYYCFGCGAGGTVFTFLQQIEGIEFIDALKRLASEAGIEVESGKSSRDEGERKRLKKLMIDADNFYRAALESQSNEGKAAREYLKKRGVTKESIEHFGLGIAPNAWDAFTVKALRAGYSNDDLLAVGLAAPRKDGSGIYDRFRNRLLFPIRSVAGETVGFGGRDLSGDDNVPKYINSPNTKLYNKSRTIFNLDKSRPAISDAGNIIVVEGYFDVLGLWQVGFPNVVATSGTALNEEIAGLLSRFSKDIIMIFDGDAAGLNATRRAMTQLLNTGARIRVVTLPINQDPFDIAIDSGNVGIQRFLTSAVDWIEFIFDGIRGEMPDDDIGSKIRAIREIETLLEALPSELEKAFWMNRFSEMLGIAAPRGRAGTNTEKRKEIDIHPIIKDVERNLLRVFLKYPKMIEDYSSKLEQADFENDQVLRVLSILRQKLDENDPVNATITELDDEDTRFVTELIMIVIPNEDTGKAASLCINEIIRRSDKRRLNELRLFPVGDEMDEDSRSRAQEVFDKYKKSVRGD